MFLQGRTHKGGVLTAGCHKCRNQHLCQQYGANSADSTDAPTARFDYSLSAITEGQWNMTTGRGAWANRLDASLGIGLWRGHASKLAF